MKSKWQIILSGVGGQGLIAAGSLLAEAAILWEDKYATLSSSYGVETRGTFSKSDVIISDYEIFYPEVMKEDIILALAQVAYDRYVSKTQEDVYLIYDSGNVNHVKESNAKQIGIPFTELARDLGNIAVANIIALGVIIQLTGMLKEESVVSAIRSTFKEKSNVIDMNLKALRKGIEIKVTD